METKAGLKLRAALFADKDSAEAAYKAALNRGYRPEDIYILMSDSTRKSLFGTTYTETEMGDKSMEGLALGGALGGTLLGTLGAVVALATTITIPPLGLVIAGPLAAGLIGAGAGSIAGGIIGALIGAGVPEEHAKIYEKGIKKGDILVGVKSDLEDDELLEDWKKYHGKNIY